MIQSVFTENQGAQFKNIKNKKKKNPSLYKEINQSMVTITVLLMETGDKNIRINWQVQPVY